MDRLGVFDQLFYKADQYGVISMIMGGASVLAPARPGETLDAQAIAGHLAARLANIPLLRVKMVQDPLRLGTVRRVEDPDFDIGDHISVTTLPVPGGYHELRHCLADLSATPLPLSKLWHWTVIGGLEGGKVAVDCQVHHALADGVGIVDVLSAMYDMAPVEPEPWPAEPAEMLRPPSSISLIRDAARESAIRLTVRTPRFLLQKTGPALRAIGSGLREFVGNGGKLPAAVSGPEVTPTSLNIRKFSDSRSLAWRTLPLAEVKAVARHFGCKVNDVGLLLFSFAMQHYLEANGELIDNDLWCAMPMSTRKTGDDEGGNQLAIGRLSLHNTIPDPVQRLAAIHRDAREVKESARPESPVVTIEDLSEVLFPVAIDGLMYAAGKLNLLGRVSNLYCYANAILSNVPGAPIPVYVANGLMVESIPKIPALEIIAVSGGFTSMGDAITLGFHCDGETVEDPDLFVRGVDFAWKALHKAMPNATPKAKRKAMKKAPPKQRPAQAKSGKRRRTSR